MMIKGIGVDIVQTIRIFTLFEKYGDKFLRKALHPNEIQRCHLLRKSNVEKQQQYLGTIWAVKEALVKATQKRLLFPEIEYYKKPNGAPQLKYYGSAHHWMSSQQINTHLSVSHDGAFTVAFIRHLNFSTKKIYSFKAKYLTTKISYYVISIFTKILKLKSFFSIWNPFSQKR
ncbi:hypothetical protein RFI_04751 [Reticulomyxa filosa]|uniref:4'-phosphopantetheinyl transferase domain-containing protein n=1 Tax=Reticulomyxa filosa TaxID=46433 RepID=X6P1F2_RETFI|nr:hypothetical protein RFI_04751 [Reticulomyxa filosa]|eukprot:ETO32365.1 hypothetical protein RFI_04751 [Reticulomyxa filosa]